MIKILIKMLVWFTAISLSLIAFLLSPTALRWGITCGAYFIPGKLEIKHISGVIIGPIILKDVHYKNSDVDIHLKKIRLNWHPWQLIHHRIAIEKVEIDQLTLAINDDTPFDWRPKAIKSYINTFIDTWTHFSHRYTVKIEDINSHHIAIYDDKKINPGLTIETLQLHGHRSRQHFHLQFNTILTQPTQLTWSLILDGTKDHYHITNQLTGVHTNFTLQGENNPEKITLKTLHNQLLAGTFNATLFIDKTKKSDWQADVIGNNINLSLLNKQFANPIQCNFKSTGDHTTALKTKNDLHILTKNGFLHFILSVDHAIKIDWHIKTVQLAHWAPVTSGEFSSRGHVEGDIENPDFNIEAKTHFKSASLDLESASLLATGDFKNHTFTFASATPKEKLTFEIHGHYHNDQWLGYFKKFDLHLLAYQKWVLAKEASLTVTKNKIRLKDFNLIAPGTGKLTLQGEWSPQKIMATLTLDCHQFDWLRAFTRKIDITPGTMSAAFTLSGTPKTPILTGTFDGGKTSIIERHLKISLTNVHAKIKNLKNKILVDLTALSNHQPIMLQGNIDPYAPTLTAEGTLKTQNLLFINTDEYVAYTTTNLTAKIDGNHILLSGNIAIPKANIHPSDYQTTVTLPDRDIVFVGNITPNAKPFWDLQSNITVTLGKEVVIDTSGIKANLEGTLHLAQPTANQIPLASGQIFIKNGTYTVYGKTLKISSDSYLNYTNSLLNDPGLNIRATKRIDSVENMGISNFTRDTLLVGLQITGTVKNPKISFFSNRANLSEADILSYIVLGYANSNTPGNTDFLLRALSAVDITSQGLMGKQNLASQIQSGLGLHELGVESETTVDALGNPLNNQSAFVVGRNITQHIYVRYSVGILDPINVFQVRYLFNENWAVQGESSSIGNGGDVLYTIRKN